MFHSFLSSGLTGFICSNSKILNLNTLRERSDSTGLYWLSSLDVLRTVGIGVKIAVHILSISHWAKIKIYLCDSSCNSHGSHSTEKKPQLKEEGGTHGFASFLT